MCCVCGGGADPVTGEAFNAGTVDTEDDGLTRQERCENNGNSWAPDADGVWGCQVTVTESEATEYVVEQPVTESYSESFMCVDSNAGALDSYDDGCEYYLNSPDECGMYDDEDFFASEMCCACGGGDQSSISGEPIDTEVAAE